MTKIEIKNWLAESIQALSAKSDFPQIEAYSLLGLVTGKTREWLVSHDNSELSESQTAELNQLLSRLIEGEPLPYLTGKQSFYGLDFSVNPNVLIPRPETELLVEECLSWLETHPNQRKIADVGTGSGIIAICLADRFPDAKITAIDLSEKALEVARENAKKLVVENSIDFIENDLLNKIDDRFDLIAANLPYIPTVELNRLNDLRYEPQSALDGGEDGLVLIKRLLEQSKNKIYQRGVIILEIEANQAESVKEIAGTFFPNSKISILIDLAKHPRIAKIQL